MCVKFGLLAFITRFRPRLAARAVNWCFRRGDLGRYREAFGQLAPVSRIAQVQECLDIWFELGFELVRMAVRQGAVVAGVDVDVGAVETDYAASSGWRDGRRRCRARRRRARRR
jgi:hypothetical protein